jgi:toxin ParE1/3/4
VKRKPVIPRKQAHLDTQSILEYYLAEADQKVALGFVDGLEKAYAHLSRHPASGSTRFAYELNLSGLQIWPLARYPYVIFYIERHGHVDVWRVLHAHTDIPEWLHELPER